MSTLPTGVTPLQPAPKLDQNRIPGPKKPRWVLWTVVLLLVALAGIAYYTHRAHTAAAGAGRPGGGGGRRGPGGFGMNGPLPVSVTKVARGNINVVLDALGTVTPLATATIRTQVNGVLVQVNFTEGQLVKKGDLLAVVDPRPYQAALEQAQGTLLQAQAQLKEAQIDLDRYKTLSTQDSISKQQVDAQAALVSQYEGMAKTDQGLVDSATVNLAYTNITAPFAGRIGLRLVDEGNYVTPGDATGLAILTQIDPVTVIFSLAEDYIPAVQRRLRSKVPIPVTSYDRTGTNSLSAGTLTTIDNTIDTTTGQFKLRATFPNKRETLFTNQFVNIKMLLTVDEGLLVIPTSAIERGQQGTYVYVVDGQNKVAAKTVTLGDSEGENVGVTGDIKEGDLVVVDGADRLKDGMEVVPQEVAAKGAPGGAAAPAAKPKFTEEQRAKWRQQHQGDN
jgi:multidrug efflux system membrane fusion protein